MKNITIGEFEELVLLTVGAQHDTAYGVSIQKSLEEQLSRSVNISSIHVALKRMKEKGLLDSHFGGITSDRGGRRKKFYVITAFGKSVLDNQFKIRTSIYQKIPQIQFGS